MEQHELELTKSNLKVQALLQTVSELHNQIADHRAEVTMLANELNRVTKEHEKFRNELENNPSPEAADEIVEEPQVNSDTK